MHQLILDYYSKNYSPLDIKKCVGRTAKKHKITSDDVENIIIEYLEIHNKELDIPDDVLKIILLNTDINKLSEACRANTRSVRVCNTVSFWENKFKHDGLIIPDLKLIPEYKSQKVNYAAWIYEYNAMSKAIHTSNKLVDYILKFPQMWINAGRWEAQNTEKWLHFDIPTKMIVKKINMSFLPKEIFSTIQSLDVNSFLEAPTLLFNLVRYPHGEEQFKIIFEYFTKESHFDEDNEDEDNIITVFVDKQEFVNCLAQLFYYCPSISFMNGKSKFFSYKELTGYISKELQKRLFGNSQKNMEFWKNYL
jgi:hypothetical protein